MSIIRKVIYLLFSITVICSILHIEFPFRKYLLYTFVLIVIFIEFYLVIKKKNGV